MPYVNPEHRLYIYNPQSGIIYTKGIHTAGDLNFAITMTVLSYLSQFTKVGYGDLNEVMGVLACVMQEFYRRMAVPYEDRKREENGDVFWMGAS